LRGLRLRGGEIEVEFQPALLEKTKEWLDATTFEGEAPSTPFMVGR
jgi:hypothetical protein